MLFLVVSSNAKKESDSNLFVDLNRIAEFLFVGKNKFWFSTFGTKIVALK